MALRKPQCGLLTESTGDSRFVNDALIGPCHFLQREGLSERNRPALVRPCRRIWVTPL